MRNELTEEESLDETYSLFVNEVRIAYGDGIADYCQQKLAFRDSSATPTPDLRKLLVEAKKEFNFDCSRTTAAAFDRMEFYSEWPPAHKPKSALEIFVSRICWVAIGVVGYLFVASWFY